jgi:hypothetical protein
MMDLKCIKLQTERQKKPEETIKETSGFVRPKRDKCTKLLLAGDELAPSLVHRVASVASKGVCFMRVIQRHDQTL